MIYHLIMKKFFLIFILISLFSGVIFLTKNIYYEFTAFNMCIDTGICPEGTKTKLDNEIIVITEENCKAHNRVWNPENRMCSVREFKK